MLDQIETMTQEDLDWFLSWLISTWAYKHQVEIKNIKIKESKADNIFDNPGYQSFISEITLV